MQGGVRLSAADYVVLLAYLAAVVGVGLKAARRRSSGSEDYILAGRSLTLPTFVAALVTSFYGGALGIGEYTYRYGLSNWVIQGLPYYLFAGLYAVFLAGRVRARPGLTVPDHLESAYGKPTAVLGAVLVFILACPADDVLMLGILAQWVTGWSLALCVSAVTAIGVCFLFAGGMRAEAWTGRLEFLVMFGGVSLLLPFAYLAAGGLGVLSRSLPRTHLSLSGGHPPLYLLTWFFIALWTFVDPSFHQRVCAAKDVSTARRGIALSVGFWFCFDAMTTLAGLYARALLPDLDDPLAAYPALASRLLPPACLGLFLAGLASSTIAALGTKSFLSAVSLARDGAGRLLHIRPEAELLWIRWGLLLTSVLSVAMALALPSVVGLWYAIGSTTIPGLLVVLVSSYFASLRVSPSAALLSSSGGWLASLAAWAWGHETPFYPGLWVSLGVWAAARAWRALRESVPARPSEATSP